MFRAFLILLVCSVPSWCAAQTTVNVNNGGVPAVSYGPAAPAPASINCPTVEYAPVQPMAAPPVEYVIPQPMSYTTTRVRTYSYSVPVRTTYSYAPRTYSYAAPPPMFPLLAYRSSGVSSGFSSGCGSLLGLCARMRYARKALKYEAKAAYYAILAGET